ncbi:fibronectin type III-like domain-contianing protein [Microbacterium sp. NEAU-LLC]|uniref:Fibronectin type III-like domain-contianing protein n=1 Tax=Microbacterium helvum TaxID=2773713 RepID=A0ABR8NQ01_9MICO|nr:fibronectin type III-like domain-contianing protein [Microbacterium helvum]
MRRPVRELAAFAKVHLEPGESKVVELPLDRRAFAYWDAVKHRWRVQPGTYRVELGRSSAEVVASVELPLEGDTDKPEPLTLESAVGDWFAHPVVGPALMQAITAEASEQQLGAASENENMLKMVESMPMGQFVRFPGVENPDAALEQLMALSV